MKSDGKRIILPLKSKLSLGDTTFVVNAIYKNKGEELTQKLNQLLKHEIIKKAYH